MIQLIYESRAIGTFRQTDLLSLLEHARKRNAHEGITGILIFHKGTFLQVLEGPKDAVEACFDRIEKDRRHSSIWMLASMTMKGRAFANWSMGVAATEDLPDGFQGGLRDFDRVKARMDEFRKTDPDGESAYTARVVGSFFRQFGEMQTA